jgi:D-alanyl-lipoteichoic acid acyltransferase DltB (MBOAT superfamily)
MGWRLPVGQVFMLMTTSLAVYAIGESSLPRGQRMAMLLALLAVFLYLRPPHPPSGRLLLQPRQFIDAFFILRCMDFALSRRPDRRQREFFGILGRFLLWMFFLPTIFVGPMTSYSDFYRVYQPRLANWRHLIVPILTKIVWGGVKCAGLSPALVLLHDHLWAAALLGTTSSSLPWVGYVDVRLLVWCTFCLNLVCFYLAFSGFTDITIGLSRLAGFNLPENFDRPLLSTSPVRYWKTSNIALYRWLMTQVFFRYWDHRQITAKVVTTFLVSGLWHLSITSLTSWQAMLQIGLAFSVFGVTIAVLLQRPHTGARTWLAPLQHRRWMQRLTWAVQVALTFSFIALVHKLFWNGLTGKPLAATLEAYRMLFCGAL